MKAWQILFIFLGTYCSLVIGIAIKMNRKGIRGAAIFLSFIFPFIIFAAVIFRLFEILTEKNKSSSDKLDCIFATVYTGTTCFPLLVGFTAARLVKAQELSKKKKHRRKSPSDLIGNIYKSYEIFADKISAGYREGFA